MQYIAPANGYHYANYLLSFCVLLMNLDELNAKLAKVDKACGIKLSVPVSGSVDFVCL